MITATHHVTTARATRDVLPRGCSDVPSEGSMIAMVFLKILPAPFTERLSPPMLSRVMVLLEKSMSLQRSLQDVPFKRNTNTLPVCAIRSFPFSILSALSLFIMASMVVGPMNEVRLAKR